MQGCLFELIYHFDMCATFNRNEGDIFVSIRGGSVERVAAAFYHFGMPVSV